MTAVVLALLTAISYGLSDFVAGMASRRMPSLRVAAVVQLTALAVLAVSLPFAGGHPTHRALLWGSIGGVGAGVGSAALYRGLARGQMSVVGPISGVGAAAIPAAGGLALDRAPSAVTLLGVALAIPAVWLIAREDRHAVATRAGVTDGLLAGVGFGVEFFALSRAGPGAGLWPSAVSIAVSGAVVLALLLATGLRASGRGGAAPREGSTAGSAGSDSTAGSAGSDSTAGSAGSDSTAGSAGSDSTAGWLGAMVAGVTAGAAVGLYLIATRHGLVVVVAVLAALYPAVTVLLARALLHERSGRGQAVGLALAAGAVVAIVAG